MKNIEATTPKRRIVLVYWKDKVGNVEIFSNLKNFCASYPGYSYHTLNTHLSKGKKIFENDSVKIERKPVIASPKPDLPKRFFWEFDYDRIDWQKAYVTVIQRIIERGGKERWQELVRFYGKEKVVNSIMNEINFLPDEIIEDACNYFNLKKEELKCYIRKQSQPKLWL